MIETLAGLLVALLLVGLILWSAARGAERRDVARRGGDVGGTGGTDGSYGAWSGDGGASQGGCDSGGDGGGGCGGGGD